MVKWLLAIPHLIVLVFLWIAFVLVTAAALFAILFTARYPRALFDFNLGVLRWTWRVGYYAYGALGADRYPPFTLQDVADYPARLDIAPPGELSRGLVLVKWWLLAIPHYLVLGAILGWSGGGGASREGGASGDALRLGADSARGAPGLLSVLVLIAAVGLLFTGRYVQSIYELVMGLHRWVFRVVAYAALMTDEYPPFRLDQGATEPDAAQGESGVRPGGSPST